MIQARPVLIIYLFYLLLSNSIIGQVETHEADYYNWFDRITGIENSELHYGIVYVERHRTKGKKTKFFLEPNFVMGSVVFDGQPYLDLYLKYDVYDDELLMQVNKKVGGSILQLYKTKVDRFTIGDFDFMKIGDSTIKPGFYEVSLEKSFFSLLKKHRKNPIEQLGKKLIFYDFEDVKKECFLFYQKKYHSIKKVSDLTELFPDYAEQLQSFNKDQSSNSDFDLQLEVLLEYLDTLLNKETIKTNEN